MLAKLIQHIAIVTIIDPQIATCRNVYRRNTGALNNPKTKNIAKIITKISAAMVIVTKNSRYWLHLTSMSTYNYCLFLILKKIAKRSFSHENSFYLNIEKLHFKI